MAAQPSNLVEFTDAVYEFARFVAPPGQEDAFLKTYLDSRPLSEFPSGTFTDWRPDQSFVYQEQGPLPPPATFPSASLLLPSPLTPWLSGSFPEHGVHEPAGPSNAATSPLWPEQSHSIHGPTAQHEPTTITISAGAITGKRAYGRVDQFTLDSSEEEGASGPTPYRAHFPKAPSRRIPPISPSFQLQTIPVPSVSPTSSRATSVVAHRPKQEANRVTKPRLGFTDKGSRAGRAHFYELAMHKKLVAGDELRVPISRPVGAGNGAQDEVRDTGVFVYSGNRVGQHSDWSFVLASAMGASASVDVRVKNVRGFEEVYTRLGFTGPTVRKWSDVVRVSRGGQDMGTVMEFKERNLFD